VEAEGDDLLQGLQGAVQQRADARHPSYWEEASEKRKPNGADDLKRGAGTMDVSVI